ncbi:hypothetical protein FO059_11610 [Tomitella fengzijianii]|uniref:Biotin synthase auxiliary protein n=1 Tax=Tomitella fengzijianii TaxID=2597660 RepID=A0A516X893_9ACTN|nr:hypothetical protein FO059_11610 [Tomitella fengzijianii]
MLVGGPLDVGARRFDVHTGAEIGADAEGAGSSGRLADSFQPPRYCGVCARRMVVQVRPDGWWAQCSRHGRVDSSALDLR